MGQSWLNAPPVIKLAGSDDGGGWGAQLWAITEDYQLISTQDGPAGSEWSSWSSPDWDGAPGQIFDVAVAQQGDGRIQVFVLDNDMQLWTAWQLTPGGSWSDFAGPNWNNAPKLQRICVSQQGGGRGAQIFAINEAGDLVSAYQATAGGGDWSDWYGFGGPSPTIGLTASLQNDPRVQVYALDDRLSLWTNWQTAPGNGWATFAGPDWNSPPGPLTRVAAVAQGGSRGAQVWAIDENYALWTCYQAAPGAQWSGWLGPNWAGSPSFNQVAGAQRSDGTVQVWAIDNDLQLWTITQQTPGGDWNAWTNA